MLLHEWCYHDIVHFRGRYIFKYRILLTLLPETFNIRNILLLIQKNHDNQVNLFFTKHASPVEKEVAKVPFKIWLKNNF